MNPTQADRWKSLALDEIFLAFAASPEIARHLVFKGSRVLARRLPSAARQSLDIDSNMSTEFVLAHPDRAEQQRELERLVKSAVANHFNRLNPVRYELVQVSVRPNPKPTHPRGWNAFDVRINVKDLQFPGVRDFPALDLDIAAPEQLRPTSVEPLRINDHTVSAYALPRIAGEKMRAFLSSLPSYRRKMSKRGNAVRAKDLYDLAIVLRHFALPAHTAFWDAAAEEFVIACESRFIDCTGLETFKEDWEITHATYQSSAVVDKAIVPFEEAELALEALVAFMVARRFLPFVHPLPPL